MTDIIPVSDRARRTEADVIREAYSEEARDWVAPVQGYAAGIPWPIHLEAYDAYCKKWSRQTALIDLNGRNCRGGFSTGELDMFVPGWREKISDVGKLKAQIASLSTDKERLIEAISEAKTLIDEINERKPSRVFYGIEQALHSKLCTVRATLAIATAALQDHQS